MEHKFGASSAVTQTPHWTVVVKRELSLKAKLSIYHPTLTYGYELLVMTKRMTLRSDLGPQILQEEQEDVATESKSRLTCLACCHHDSDPDCQKMDGEMGNTSRYGFISLTTRMPKHVSVFVRTRFY